MAIEIKNMQLSSKISNVNNSSDANKKSDVSSEIETKTDCCDSKAKQDKSLQRHSKDIAKMFEARRER